MELNTKADFTKYVKELGIEKEETVNALFAFVSFAFDNGYERGYETGYDEGYDDGYDDCLDSECIDCDLLASDYDIGFDDGYRKALEVMNNLPKLNKQKEKN